MRLPCTGPQLEVALLLERASLADIDACATLPARVLVAQLCDDLYGAEARVLRQRVGHNLQRLCKGPHTVALHALQ